MNPRSLKVWRLYLCAMEAESKPLIDHYNLFHVNPSSIKNFPHLNLQMFGNSFHRMSDIFRIYMNGLTSEIALVVTGVGKVHSAAATAYAISILNPTEIMNIGLCGSLKPDKYMQGDVMNVTHVFQYDAYIPIRSPEFDVLMDKIDLHAPIKKTINHDECEYPHVTLSSGDRFIDDEESRIELSQIAEIVDMEGYAIARVCEMFNKKLRIFKIISDSASEEATSEFTDFIEIYGEKVLQLLDRI